MLPTLRPGQTLLISQFSRPKVGDVVLAIQNNREVVKRISAISNGGQVTLMGDNKAASTDSRSLGTVTITKIHGVVWWPRVNKSI